MKAAIVTAPEVLEIKDVPMPEVRQPNDVLIKVMAVGICGSDIHIKHGDNPSATYPRILGHEVAGRVEAVGSGVGDLALGDHVVVDPVNSCGKCYPCLNGHANVCTSLRVRSVHLDGGFQEYYVVDRKTAHKISPSLSWEEAAMIEPFTISAQVVWRGGITEKDRVFIIGAGPIGLCILQAVKRLGAKCVVTDLVALRLEKARSLGADLVVDASVRSAEDVVREETGGFGFPVVIDAVCTPQTFEQAIKCVIPSGRAVVLGLTKKTSQIAQFDIGGKEIDVRGTRLSSNKFPEVIGWFARREVKPLELVTHVFPFTDILKAFERAEKFPAETLKVVVRFD